MLLGRGLEHPQEDPIALRLLGFVCGHWGYPTLNRVFGVDSRCSSGNHRPHVAMLIRVAAFWLDGGAGSPASKTRPRYLPDQMAIPENRGPKKRHVSLLAFQAPSIRVWCITSVSPEASAKGRYGSNRGGLCDSCDNYSHTELCASYVHCENRKAVCYQLGYKPDFHPQQKQHHQNRSSNQNHTNWSDHHDDHQKHHHTRF